ncbi:MAG: reprolysin-like metallopeptidase [Bacteroidota bacterium]
MKSFITLLLSLFLFSANAQKYWTDIALPYSKSEEGITYENDRTLQLSWQALLDKLKDVPMEFSVPTKNSSSTIILPMPDGRDLTFKVVESPVMMEKLASRYPQIKAYKAVAEEDARITARFDIAPNSFHASMRTPAGRIYIDPIDKNANHYRSFYVKDTQLDIPLSMGCGVNTKQMFANLDEIGNKTPTNDLEKNNSETQDLRTYRLALSCTAEYAQAKGGTVESVLATFNTATNRLNEIYEIEVGIRFLLVDDTEKVIFFDAVGDPFPNARNGGQILSINTQVLNNNIGSNNYDVGHAFTLACDGLGGVASLASVCGDNKGAATTCHFSSSVAFVAAGTFAHEVGHQFSASHSWHNCPGSEDQRPSTSYEPGSGSTIMSYSGGCGNQNLSGGRDAYFHGGNIEQMIVFSRERRGNTCATIIPVNNQVPELSLNYEDGFSIPISTPFELVVQANDPDNENLTYCWEQFDTEIQITPLANPSGSAPLFRSFEPRRSPRRIFPDIRTIVNNDIDLEEQLPDYGRDLTFRCTVRDNDDEAGATVWAQVAFKADETAGPFLVTAPNTSNVEWEVGQYYEVNWDVANTDNPRVNCKRVNILLSTDGGFSYPHTLAEGEPNDGSALVSLPDVATNRARIKIEAADNIFFDISNRDFRIVPPTAPTFTLSANPVFQEVCLPASTGVTISTETFLGFSDSIELSIANLPDGVTASFSETTIAAGESSILILELEDNGRNQILSFDLIAVADTLRVQRPIDLEVLTNDFSDLSLILPFNNTKGVIGITDFTWTPLFNADTYEFQLANSPTFDEASLVVEEIGLTDTLYRPDVFLEENTIYYWRIRPVNQCGAADYTIPNVFQTLTVRCAPFEQTNSVIISGSGTPTVESTISIDTDGTITDLNIPNVRGAYPPVRFIEMSLISPAGTQVILYDDLCGSTRDFNLGFDDEAPDPISCPPVSAVPQRPVGNLSDFDGESIRGDWKMRFRVKDFGFGSGRIESWSLESCGDVNVSAPFLVANEVFELPPASRSQIWTTVLEADDEDNTASEISFQLVGIPENGILYRNEVALQVGDRFTQQDINGYLISYEHDGSESTIDDFHFVLLDTDGGWFGTATFNIVISEDATVNTEEEAVLEKIKIYPNPAKALLSVEFPISSELPTQIQLFNVSGQMILEHPVSDFLTTIDVSNLADGIYLLRVQAETKSTVERIVIQR